MVRAVGTSTHAEVRAVHTIDRMCRKEVEEANVLLQSHLTVAKFARALMEGMYGCDCC